MKNLFWLMCALPFLVACPDTDEAFDVGPEVDASDGAGGMGGVGGMDDAGQGGAGGDVEDGGPGDDMGAGGMGGEGGGRCAEVECPRGEICHPNTGECVGGGPTVPCDDDDACGGVGECLSEADTGLPGGVCNVECRRDADCGVDGACVTVSTGPEDLRYCFQTCAANDCREGWICLWGDSADESLCVPDCRVAGCGDLGVCDQDSGECVDFAPGGQTEDGLCAVDGDVCAPGLTCIRESEDGAGRCRPLCDPADPSGCARDSICVPLADSAPEGRVDLGACVRGAGCDPADPAAACGEGSSCVAAAPVTFCAPEGDGQAGELCGDEAWCAPGLFCQYGRCVAPCGARGLCEDGLECVAFPEERAGVAFDFCHDGCDVFNQRGCEDGACAAVDVLDRDVLGACTALPTGERQHGQTCTPDDNRYWGDCAAGHVCDVVTGEQATCNRLCDSSRVGSCRQGLCTRGLFDAPFEEMGLCLGGCNVLGDASGCPVRGEVCNFTDLWGTSLAGGEQPVGVCTPSAGRKDAGERCALDENTGVHDCRNGHLCARLEVGAPNICVRLCDPRVDNACGRDAECIDEVFGEDRPLGICLPGVPFVEGGPPRITGFEPGSGGFQRIETRFRITATIVEPDGDNVRVQWSDAACPRCPPFAEGNAVTVRGADFARGRCGAEETIRFNVRAGDRDGSDEAVFEFTVIHPPC